MTATAAPSIDPKRLERVMAIDLRAGAGDAPNGKIDACVMQAVAYVAGEPWSDHPQCASEVLTAFCIRLNDRWGHEDRQLLKPFIPRLVGTRAPKAIEHKRRQMLLDFAFRRWLPIWLRKAGLEEHAAKMEALKIGATLTQAQRTAIYAARDAAWKKRSGLYAEVRAKVKAELEAKGLAADADDRPAPRGCCGVKETTK